MELKDLKTMNFKEIAKKFNDSLKGLAVTDSSDQSDVKREIFQALERTFDKIKIQEIDYHYNKFEVEVEYQNDFNGIKNYDKGRIKIVFSIKTKRTDKMEKVSKTRSKYIHTRHENPVAFVGFDIWSNITSYDWKDEGSDSDIKITGDGWSHSNRAAEEIRGDTVEELIMNLKGTYLKQFRLDIVQPYLKHLFVFGKRRDAIYNALTDELKQLVDKKDNVIFEKLADFIIDKNLIA